jgi:rod shape determining protein RodA
MLLLGGVRARYLIVMVLLGVGLSVAVLTSDTLADYQRDRLTSFIDPGIDAQGITYNQNQSVTAVASGGFAGQGLFDGPQTQLRFVPEQETDFIFTVVAEELGFVGGALVLGLFGVVCWRLWRIARSCRDNFGYLLTGGVLIMLLFQLFSNVGMAIGIMPITGTALPFISYGGSSILTTLVSLGLALSVGMRRFD